MRHLVLFRFRPDYFDSDMAAKTESIFRRLKEELPEDIQEVAIRRNCVQRDVNADICVDMQLTGEASLDRYLKHPIHMALVKEWMPNIVNRISVDYPEA